MIIDIQAVIRGYVICLLWSESCRGSAGGDHEHSTDAPEDCDASLDYIGYDPEHLTDAARKEIESEVTDFVQANAEDIAALIDGGKCDAEQIGHDFLLTRNGHGAGFWDRGYGAVGDRLSDASRPYGTMSAYIDEDDRVGVDG